jgi:5-formyltetrahydrofolate cyclo-ligase
MHYRAWNGQAPTLRDECGVPSTDGTPVTPDVVLAPCVGFTDDAFRLGYGGGYFDRWLDAHPHAVAIGVCWSVGRIDAREFAPEPHDRAMGMVVTEDGVVAD